MPKEEVDSALADGLKDALAKEMEFVMSVSKSATEIFDLMIQKKIQPFQVMALKKKYKGSYILNGKCNKVTTSVYFELFEGEPPLDRKITKEVKKEKASSFFKYVKGKSGLSVEVVKIGLHRQFEWESKVAQVESQLQLNEDQQKTLREIKETVKESGDYPAAFTSLDALLAESNQEITFQSPQVWELVNSVSALIKTAMGLIKGLKMREGDPEAASLIGDIKLKSADFRQAIADNNFKLANQLFAELSDMTVEDESAIPPLSDFDAAWPQMKQKCTDAIDSLGNDMIEIETELRKIEQRQVDIPDGVNYNNPLEILANSLKSKIRGNRFTLTQKFLEVDRKTDDIEARYAFLRDLHGFVAEYYKSFETTGEAGMLINLVQFLGFGVDTTASVDALKDLNTSIETLAKDAFQS